MLHHLDLLIDKMDQKSRLVRIPKSVPHVLTLGIFALIALSAFMPYSNGQSFLLDVKVFVRRPDLFSDPTKAQGV